VKTLRNYINPSLLYKIGKRTNLLLQSEYLKAKLTPDFGIGMLDSGRILPNSIPISRFHNVDWAYNTIEQIGLSLSLDHSFNDDWKLYFSSSLQKQE